MKRGDLVTISLQGDFGKPRPALVIQADQFMSHSSVTVLPLTSTIVDAPLLRFTIRPSKENSLKKASQVMIDKTMTIQRNKLGAPFGHVDPKAIIEIEQRLALFFGIAH
ncbi:type II toxin-antitoxin system PemK/MazF family toxin [Bartonella sp. DGB2]|uniref:type II toxin-antitoxin system PemK/MazF family toxin n=1 Tax=Bartonella sp. DGB2 TaxID=3388426 RepID=UPI00398F9645